MLNASGGVIDDLIVLLLWMRLSIVWWLTPQPAKKILAWITEHAKDYVVDIQVRDDLALIAVQGPHARKKVQRLLRVNRIAK